MTLFLKLGWRNLWRNPRRSALELTSLAGAVFLVATMLNIQAGMYPVFIKEAARSGGGHVGFYRTGYLELRQANLAFPAGPLLDALARDEAVKAALARVHLPGLARSSRDSRGAAMIGMDFERELPINPLLKSERLIDGRLPAPDAAWDAVLGADLARELALKPGKKFVWMCQDASGETVSRLMHVSGILKTGVPELDKTAVLAHRESAARLLGLPGEVHELAVLLESDRRARDFLPTASRLASGQRNVVALTWDQSMPQIADAIKLDRTGGWVFAAFLLMLVGLGTVNTMLMSVLERAREFGVLRALGLGGPGVIKMVLGEGLVLGLVGSALGLAASALLGVYTSTRGIDFSGFMGEGQEMGGIFVSPVVYTGWDWPKLAVLAGLMTALSLAASLYPTWKALKIRPADAMRVH